VAGNGTEMKTTAAYSLAEQQSLMYSEDWLIARKDRSDISRDLLSKLPHLYSHYTKRGGKVRKKTFTSVICVFIHLWYISRSFLLNLGVAGSLVEALLMALLVARSPLAAPSGFTVRNLPRFTFLYGKLLQLNIRKNF